MARKRIGVAGIVCGVMDSLKVRKSDKADDKQAEANRY
jgi:hypothetical protein